jgi:hypothetical protein
LYTVTKGDDDRREEQLRARFDRILIDSQRSIGKVCIQACSDPQTKKPIVVYTYLPHPFLRIHDVYVPKRYMYREPCKHSVTRAKTSEHTR